MHIACYLNCILMLRSHVIKFLNFNISVFYPHCFQVNTKLSSQLFLSTTELQNPPKSTYSNHEFLLSARNNQLPSKQNSDQKNNVTSYIMRHSTETNFLRFKDDFHWRVKKEILKFPLLSLDLKNEKMRYEINKIIRFCIN